MKNELALRYLLLRHMELFESAVPPEDFLEVVRSLRVGADRECYSVVWTRAGTEQRRSIPRGEFRFYERGDRNPQARMLEESRTNANDARARRFAEEVFGCPAPVVTGAPAPTLEPHRGVAMLAAGLLGALLLVAGLGVAPALGVTLWALAEFAPRGRLLACAPLLGLAVVGPGAAVALGALAYALLQALDPDPRQRGPRVALCAAAAALAAARMLGGGLEPGLGAAIVVVAAVALAVQRSLFAVHVRAVPLALPAFATGLALGGLVPAAWLLLGFVALDAIGAAFLARWLPVQRQQ